MVNAVWRTGAVPVFADIDNETFGSVAREIEKRITARTRVIVAQHSFGIPCAIDEIVKLGKKYGIFVIEDCAITLDSSFKGVKVGNWADAAIFSTDHSKPLNTLIGGFLYTKTEALYKKIRDYASTLPHFTKQHQQRLYKQLIFERQNHIPSRYGKALFLKRSGTYLKSVFGRKNRSDIFLEADYARQPSADSHYPYPAKMPPFLAKLGLFELERWVKEKMRRESLLKEYMSIMSDSGKSQFLPKCYFNQDVNIVPLRFVFQLPNSQELVSRLSVFLDVNQIWFRQPIICSNDTLENLGYKIGSCPVSERVGSNLINWPCVISEAQETRAISLFQDSINQ
jgi:dTDP-4-amino-4,6-dideoxygalactose transaminase